MVFDEIVVAGIIIIVIIRQLIRHHSHTHTVRKRWWQAA